jgi:hypothetical protein
MDEGYYFWFFLILIDQVMTIDGWGVNDSLDLASMGKHLVYLLRYVN